MWLINSSIGRKVVMSVTGIALVLFLTFHASMNVVALISEDGYNLTNFVMSCDHWEFTDKKSHVTMVEETYATDHGFMDKAEFKDKKQEIKDDHKSAMLESLESYATAHGVPALSSSMRQAIKKLKYWR